MVCWRLMIKQIQPNQHCSTESEAARRRELVKGLRKQLVRYCRALLVLISALYTEWRRG